MTTLQERLQGANQAQANTSQEDVTRRLEEDLKTNSLRVRNQLGRVLGCHADEVPEWYTTKHPHILMNLDELERGRSSALAKQDLRNHYKAAMSHEAELKAEAMAHEYRAVILKDHNGNRSTLVVEHKQSANNGKATYPKHVTYLQNSPSVFQVRLVDFAGVEASEWVDQIGLPEDCTINETSAPVLFEDLKGMSYTEDQSVEKLCIDHNIDYWYRPSSYVVVGLFNGANLRQMVAVQFDELATAKTSLFNCQALSGDRIEWLSVPMRDKADAHKAMTVISNNTQPKYFKWCTKLTGVFL